MTRRENYQVMSGIGLPAAMILERKSKQNQRGVKKARITGAKLRELNPKEWDRLFAEVSEELEALPIVGDPCDQDGCSGIYGLRTGHIQYCPVGRDAKYPVVD